MKAGLSKNPKKVKVCHLNLKKKNEMFMTIHSKLKQSWITAGANRRYVTEIGLKVLKLTSKI